MVRVFMGFADEAAKAAVVASLQRLGPWPDAELIVHPDDGVLVECHGQDVAGAQLLVQRRLWAALAGTGVHPEGVQLLATPPHRDDAG